MKPKRFYFRTASIFCTPLKFGMPVFVGFTIIISGLDAQGGDILRGGSASGGKPGAAAAGGAPVPAAANAARANARDTLARTTRTMESIRAMQKAARKAARQNGSDNLGQNPRVPAVKLPNVPNGIGIGGLQVSAAVALDPSKWTGAKLPSQKISKGKTEVTIKQTERQALLEWETFNVGKKTTVTFDQSKGGENASQWVAFNKITDPSGNPTQILGNIKADGQIYLINTNGIIFGGGSQVNARGLTASSLPVNTNLIQRGLLNNPDAQFLFSGIDVPGGSDGTPEFSPDVPVGGVFGDVTVQAGAVLKSPSGGSGNGGRIMLVGPNVTNDGTISTDAGQTILAAGLQVGVAAHDGKDPSLRGLDVWVGAVGEGNGTATNSGLIEARTGSTWMTGRHVNQLGAIESSTSVNLNGRIDLVASYGAVANPNFDSTADSGSGGPMFLNQFTGVVTLGEKSAMSILPDYLSKNAVPGLALPERSQINIEGQAIHFESDSTLFAPNAEVAVRAGTWQYKDLDGNGTIFDADGKPESGLINHYSGSRQNFFFNAGQIFLDQSAVINVAGSTDVFVPLSQSILDVELRGSELADSPIQRDTPLRGATLTVDIRNTGTYDGKYWIGTPLGDVTGLAGLIERNAAQLTAVGGNISLRSGGSIVVSKGSSLDVSGGTFNHQGGVVKTSYLVSNGRLVDIKDATPNLVYEGVFSGKSTFVSEKWGVVDSFATPLFSGTYQEGFVEGAAGGTLTLTAPSMAIDGELRGATVEGPRQRANPAAPGKLVLNFSSQRRLDLSANQFVNITASPTPPDITFAKTPQQATAPEFLVVDDVPALLPEDRTSTVTLSTRLFGKNGFGAVEIANTDGSITVPENVTLSTGPKGSVAFSAANISVLGSVDALGGALSFTTYNLSPSFIAEYNLLSPPGSAPFPEAVVGRGNFTLGQNASLSTAAVLVNDSNGPIDFSKSTVMDGGTITINSYQANLTSGSSIDVSGGAYVSEQGKISYGKGGAISILTGRDPGFDGNLGGSLTLGATLRGFSGTRGGSLAIQAARIRVGGLPAADALHLDEEFFRQGGFSSYALTGFGSPSGTPAVGVVQSYKPAVEIVAGSNITPRAASLIVVADPEREGDYRLDRIVEEPGVRAPVSLSFTALGVDDLHTLDTLESRGDIMMGEGARIVTDAGASVSFKGGTVTLLGSVTARGGSITVAGANAFPLTASQRLAVTQALATVHLGASAKLSTAGITQLVPNEFGLRVGKVFDGGRISVSGNILAEAGSVMDVSGASGVLDLNPSMLGTAAVPTMLTDAGLLATPYQQVGVATRIDSNGGRIDLTGSEMLLSDATLRGSAGGKSATGGSLSVFSGAYYAVGASRTSADVNLVVKQSGNVILNPAGELGVGLGLTDAAGQAYGGAGFFAVDRFTEGKFASLELGGKTVTGSPFSYGGNIDFKGPIDIQAKGTLRLAAGGVIRADDAVKISASYVAIGQDFRDPAHPDDVFEAFQKDPALPTSEHNFAPTFGNGSLDLDAGLIDVGTLSLQGIGRASLTANGGDIRGNGTLSMAGDLVLKSAQIYPTTLGNFDIFAYDHDGIAGSVTIQRSGKAEAPLSAGGKLGIFASNIIQSGVLRAPLGSIQLGWDGTAGTKPRDIIAGASIEAPIASTVTLEDGSLTSVSAKGLEIPFGTSPDGLTWIDPRGVNVTLTGLPDKEVLISGDSVTMAAGATVDIQGGGDLLASRWVPGNGGSRNLLGEAGSGWGQGTQYEPGDLVSFNGETWSARVRHSAQTPGANLYWSKVQESFAIVPGFNAGFAPIASYNSGPNSGSLAGNPGLVGNGLKVGDTITLEASSGLPAGTYTLLPRGYANLKGAFLVTAVDSAGMQSFTTTDGANYVSGYLSNSFSRPGEAPAIRSRFEIASSKVLALRAEYEVYSANEFIAKAGGTQLLPGDAGYAAFQGNVALQLDGMLRTASTGRGAIVDISSDADIALTGGAGVVDPAATAVLDTATLTSWGVDSLLIGGIRTRGKDATTVDVRTSGVTLDNPDANLSGPEIVLVSKGELNLSEGASISSVGKLTGIADTLVLDGDGVLLRVSSDAAASILRENLAGGTAPLLEVAASATISGNSVILDSTYGTVLSPEARIDANTLKLGSGQISVVFDDATGPLQGSTVEPHLTLAGVTLDSVKKSKSLTLLSYRSIDFYGTGTLGGSALDSITLSSNGVRGYQQGGGEVIIRANDVRFENPSAVVASTSPSIESGQLSIDAKVIHLGDNATAVSGFETLALNASGSISFESDGSLSTTGNLVANTPVITGVQGSRYALSAVKMVSLLGGKPGIVPTGNLGASLTIEGASLVANSDITLPGGELVLRATDGNVEVGGSLSVAGSFRTFDELVRIANAGSITLESLTGDVIVSSKGDLSVAASDAGGNAGTLVVKASQGHFSNAGLLHGEGGVGGEKVAAGRSGSIRLDVGSFTASGSESFGSISRSLDAGGFHQTRDFRVRNGDVVLSNENRSHNFLLSADRGSILVTGGVDASGVTGGVISLAAHGNLTVASGAVLNAGGLHFNSAGKGGSILLEAGTQLGGVANTSAQLNLRAGASIILGVADHVAGNHTDAGSSASQGKFTGTLHLRAPRTAGNDDLGVGSIASEISGASSVLVEGYTIYQPVDGVLDIALRNQIHSDSQAFLGTAGSVNANETAMLGRLLAGAADASALSPLLVLAPGVEIINPSGDLVLGLENLTGSTNREGLAAADWDLSSFRYGSRSAPGVLTLRASGDVVFNNTLSDGFDPIAQGTTTNFAANGHSLMWLATLSKIKDTLPLNTQSWSYRLTAGADLASSNYRSVLTTQELDPGKGSLIVGEFHAPVPNTNGFGSSAAIGPNGLTANSIRISSSITNRGNRFEVVRTGTGDITISAGRDVQLRNTFSTIYTAGVALPDPTTIYQENDFVVPVVPDRANQFPSQSAGGATLGEVQQLFKPTWSMAGGNISINAAADIARYTMVDGILTVDSSRQMPTNWLYRRGFVDPQTGLFSNSGGIDALPGQAIYNNITDAATSTTWWVDSSNFFQGVGTLGGGNVDLTAGNDVVNVDAVAPTNARMAGRKVNPEFGIVPGAPEFINLAPDETRMLELGGGDVTVTAGRNIDGGVYYVERGKGTLFAGGSITTNAARTPSSGILESIPALDPLTWMPTTLFVGKSNFDVAARGDVLLGPVNNAFLMPQGLMNEFWYKTYFNTFSADSGVTAASYGGDVTHRYNVTLDSSFTSRNVLDLWYSGQNGNGGGSGSPSSYFQPWLRLSEYELETFSSVFKLTAPNLSSTSFGGNLNLVGDVTLFPSATGNLELAAANSIVGLNDSGLGFINGRQARVWTDSTVNVSDASPDLIPGITTPLAYQTAIGRSRTDAVQSNVDILQTVSLALSETGSSTGAAGTSAVKQALHSPNLLHAGDRNPVTVSASSGDITGLTLFSPKATRITAGRDITDIAFYLQNVSAKDITLVSAGGDIVPFNENSEIRAVAADVDLGNAVGGSPQSTAAGDSTNALAGDIQINGPGVLEVLAGGDLDLGTGANFSDGTGVGITSIGNLRNPNLPFSGADIIALAGITGEAGALFAGGLSNSSLFIDEFIARYIKEDTVIQSPYLKKLGIRKKFSKLTPEQQAIVALEQFYRKLRDAGRNSAKKGNYKSGYQAVRTLFGTLKPEGEIFTRAREIRTTSGGSISLGVPGGGITMASAIFGNPLTPPGIVTEYGGGISTFTDQDVSIGQARIFTLRGGDITMWSSRGNIAAGTSPKTVVTAPPTRVVIDITSADVQTDLGGLATGGGIGVLAAVKGVKPGNVDLIAPKGFVDAGDAGIRVTGNLNIAAQTVLNSSNISTGGTSTGTSPGAVSAPSVSTVTAASNSSAAAGATVEQQPQQEAVAEKPVEEAPSLFAVEVIGYGEPADDEEDEEEQEEE
ncbi:MAG: filamentous hemagglutinin family protein [Verrucomicrobiota bacterium]